MNNKTCFFFLIATLLVGCKKDYTLNVISKSFTENELAQCAEGTCPKINISYVTYSGEEALSEKLNTSITNEIINALYIGDSEQAPTATTIPEAAKDFIKMYTIHSAEFPDMAAAYFAETSVTQLCQTNTLVALQFKNYLFTGGAHGYGSVHFKNFDKETGNFIPKDALFKDSDAFTKFAEKKFREEFNIPSGEGINATGFWFENDRFHLPENVGITNENIIIRYNQYDIASYAEGPIEFEIPITEVQHLLNYNL